MNFLYFEEVDRKVTRLYNEGCLEEAIALLEKAMEQYPDNLYTITWDMAVFYSLMTPKQTEKSMDINPESKLWETCRESDRFLELAAKNKRRKEQAQATAEAKYEVYMPADYCEGISYPLHIAIHGWGEDIAFFKRFWKSDVLNRNCISLFIQSSKVASPIGFCWDDVELARKEIEDAYKNVLVQYSIDINRITVGGFSQGATMAMDLALNGMIKIKGFITLCPDKPISFSNEGVEVMAKKNIKGIILTGEKDESLLEQKTMVKVFEEKGFPHQFIINKGLGHWFPENLSEQMNEALDYIDS
jgi:predicted esterase